MNTAIIQKNSISKKFPGTWISSKIPVKMYY